MSSCSNRTTLPAFPCSRTLELLDNFTEPPGYCSVYLLRLLTLSPLRLLSMYGNSPNHKLMPGRKFGDGRGSYVFIQCLANVFISVELHILSCNEDELQCIYWDVMSYDDLSRLPDDINEELYSLEKSRVSL